MGRSTKKNAGLSTKTYRKVSVRRQTEEDKDDAKFLKQHPLKELDTLGESSDEEDKKSSVKTDKKEDNTQESVDHLLSPELLLAGASATPSLRAKQKHPSLKITVDASEIKALKKETKGTKRKLKQLAAKAAAKTARVEIYKTLESHEITASHRLLLTSSSQLGQTKTKKQRLKHYLELERQGVALSEEQKDELYETVEMDVEEREEVEREVDNEMKRDADVAIAANPNGVGVKPRISKKVRKAINKKKQEDRPAEEEPTDVSIWEEAALKRLPPPAPPTEPPMSFAANMMAQMAMLKSKSIAAKPGLVATQLEKDKEAAAVEGLRIEKINEGKNTEYKVDLATVIAVKTAATLNLQSDVGKATSTGPTVNRPSSVTESRTKLPVCGMEQEIVEAVKENDVLILCGETGSGKSTQTPQFLYEAGYGKIGITQPRRVAATSTAKRVAFEMGVGDGIKLSNPRNNTVAFQTRYESSGLGDATKVKFMTDGILLQEVREDLLLRQYGVVVIDEAHERSLNTDVLLGLLSGAVKLRREAQKEKDCPFPPLKLVIMSATLRVSDFTENARLFKDLVVPVMKVPGRTHPVTVHHSKDTELEDYEGEVVKKVIKIHRKLPLGGILVFLTGKDEIVSVVKRLRRTFGAESATKGWKEEEARTGDLRTLRDLDDEEEDCGVWDGGGRDNSDEEDEEYVDAEWNSNNPVTILPLYSMLAADEQSKVFLPAIEGHRVIVVATNIAETSVTIPGVSYVVDSGRQKSRNYETSSGIASYDVGFISKAAADQRAGRAGRTGPGHCYRVYSSTVYSKHLEAFAQPEMIARPIEDVVLAMKSMGIGNVAGFPFPTPPDGGQLRIALGMLKNLCCLKGGGGLLGGEGALVEGDITELGRALSKLPVSVRFAKMLLGAVGAGGDMLELGVMLVSCMSEQSPFLDPKGGEDGVEVNEEDVEDVELAAASDEVKGLNQHEMGDCMARLLACGAFAHAGQGAGGASEAAAGKAFCNSNNLNYTVLARVQTLRQQLQRVVDMRLGRERGEAGRRVRILAPPTRVQQLLLSQILCSGMLDQVAMRASNGEVVEEGGRVRRDAYISCSGSIKTPLYLSRRCALYDRDWKSLPDYVVYESIIKRDLRDGGVVNVMMNVGKVEGGWLNMLGKDSPMLVEGAVVGGREPEWDDERGEMVCFVETKYGNGGWLLPPKKKGVREVLGGKGFKDGVGLMKGDEYKWFARRLLEGTVWAELKGWGGNLADSASNVGKGKRGLRLLEELERKECCNKEKMVELLKADDKWLWAELKAWCRKEEAQRKIFKGVWMKLVKMAINL